MHSSQLLSTCTLFSAQWMHTNAHTSTHTLLIPLFPACTCICPFLMQYPLLRAAFKVMKLSEIYGFSIKFLFLFRHSDMLWLCWWQQLALFQSWYLTRAKFFPNPHKTFGQNFIILPLRTHADLRKSVGRMRDGDTTTFTLLDFWHVLPATVTHVCTCYFIFFSNTNRSTSQKPHLST